MNTNIVNLADARKAPRVLTAGYVARLREANSACRQLRALGCRVLRVCVGAANDTTEILVDRNPHRRLAGCWGVHVTCGGGAR